MFKLSKNQLVLSLCALVGSLLLVLTLLWIRYDYDISHPVNANDDSSSLIEVKKGDGIDAVAKKLAQAKLIRSKAAFALYVRFGPAHSVLQTGVYDIRPSMSIKQIVYDMENGRVATKKVIVPEGLNILGIANAVAKSGFTEKAKFLTALKDPYVSTVLASRPYGVTNIEGLLAPGTYEMLINQSAHDLVAKMIESSADVQQVYGAKIAPQNLTFYQVMTLASIVELEASNDDDRKKIAGVFLNRLRIGMKLESDTTTFYRQDMLKNGLITATEAAAMDSYAIAFPQHPICSPSTNSIDAVYNPTSSDNFYFIGDGHGHVYYAKTYAEHQANISRYL